MKKISFIALGIFLTASGVIVFSEASPAAYHAYLSQKEAGKDNHDNKTILNIRKYQLKEQKTTYAKGHTFDVRSYRNSSGRGNESIAERTKRVLRERFSSEPEYKRRVFADRKNPWQQPLQRSAYAPTSRIETRTKTYNLITYENDTFSIQIPEGWRPSREESHVFQNPYLDYTISVERLETPCNNRTFQECAINLSKALNNVNKQEIIPLSTVSRLHQFRNTIHTSRLQTETFMEGFSANVFGEEKYISRYYVSDIDGNVYIIKTEAPLREAQTFMGVSKRVFDSFRILVSD